MITDEQAKTIIEGAVEAAEEAFKDFMATVPLGDADATTRSLLHATFIGGYLKGRFYELDKMLKENTSVRT